ncbi:MAG: tetratricopeptide repeat protein [Bacteroidetes bacterium]|nr:tetratricopeptide repeat protein [Bacteroidota bacterium]
MKTNNRTFTLFAPPALWMALIAIATFIAYFPALNGTFTNWDDMVYVGGNPYIKSLSAKNLVAMFSENYMGNYHPLAMLSLAIDYQINKFDPVVFHLTNILIHIINSMLVLLVLKRLTGKLQLAVIAALLFGVHALHVESVAWISERKDVLYTCFYLLSLYSYVRYVPGRDKMWFGLSLLFFLLSCLSKGQAVTLAVTLFLVDVFMGRKWTELKILVEKVPFLILALIFGIVAFRAQAGADATIMANFPIQQRVAFASYGLVMYILKLFYPFTLSVYYPYPILGNVGEVPFIYWLCILPALAFVVALILSWKRSKPLFFGLGFFLLNIVLLLQLLPVGRAIMADRYAYIPSIGYFFLVGYYLTDRKYIKSEKATWGIVAVYALILIFLTFQQSKVWRNSDTLWSDCIEKNARVPVAWYNRGNTRMDSANYKGAIADYTECVNLDATFWRAYINRGHARSMEKDYLGSIADFDATLRFDSTVVNAYINRAVSRKMLQDYDNSLKDYNIAIRLKPEQLELYTSRASLKSDMKDYDGALSDLNLALKIDPKYTSAYTNRAAVKKTMKDLAGALADYNTAIELDPKNSEFYNNRGNLKFQLDDSQGAIDDYTTSIRISPKDFLGYKNRGAVRFSRKLYTEALADLTEAIGLSPKSGDLYYTRSLVKKAMNDLAGAKADYTKAAELDPNYAAEGFMKNIGISAGEMPGLQPAQMNKQAMLMESSGRVQDAIVLYKKALGVKPDFPEAWYNLGNAYGKTRQFGEAMNCLNNAIRYKSDYVQALSSRGIAYASMGKTDLAISDLSAAIKGDPTYAIAYFNRALVYLNSGKRDLACSDLQKAVKMGYNAAYPIYKKECQGK